MWGPSKGHCPVVTLINSLGVYLRKKARKIILPTVPCDHVFADLPKAVFFCGSFVLFICLVLVVLSHLFIAALWSPAGKGLTSCL